MLFTFGYEGLHLSDFLDHLRRADVQIVLDVRELPLSRKAGFSKRALAAALNGAGIEYQHIPALGCPKPVRHRYKEDRDWAQYTRDFKRYLKSQSAAVAEVAKTARKTSACLICFEADYRFCHRSLVAEAVIGPGGKVEHLATTTAKAEARLPDAA
jgi:uncharacterized protein (DUF488 family)